MIRSRFLDIALMMSLGCLTLQAGHSHAEVLDHYFNLLSDHPSVLQIEEQSRSFKILARSEASLPDPELILGIDNLPVSDPSFDRFLPTAKVIGFKQAIPNPTLRSTKSLLREHQSKQQRLMAEYQQRRLQSHFIKQLIEIAKVHRLSALLKEQLTLYQLIENDLQGQLEAGRAVYGRFSEVDVEKSNLEQRLNQLNAEKRTVQETLIELVETVPDIPPPTVTALTWVKGITDLYPTVIASEAIAVNSSKSDISEAGFKPNYGIQALYKQRDSGDSFEGDDWFSLQASISLPIWSRSSQTPKLEAAKARVRSAKHAYEQSQRHWSSRMASLETEQKYALDDIDLFKGKEKALKEVIASAKRNYESGNIPLEHVLNAQIHHLNITARLVSEKSRYQKLIVEFNSHIKTEGTILGGAHDVH